MTVEQELSEDLSLGLFFPLSTPDSNKKTELMCEFKKAECQQYKVHVLNRCSWTCVVKCKMPSTWEPFSHAYIGFSRPCSSPSKPTASVFGSGQRQSLIATNYCCFKDSNHPLHLPPAPLFILVPLMHSSIWGYFCFSLGSISSSPDLWWLTVLPDQHPEILLFFSLRF